MLTGRPCLLAAAQASDLFNHHKEAPVLNKNSAPHSGKAPPRPGRASPAAARPTPLPGHA
jgi:hypothetical protein